jgi:hypothetical protein
MCNKQGAQVIGILTFNKCELVRIDDLAVFYVQSIACAKNAQGQCQQDDGHYMPKAFLNVRIAGIEVPSDLLESQTTIEGFRQHPTPAALNRALLLDPAPQFLQDTMDPAVDKDGDRYIDEHAGSLPVWEKNGFYDQIRPIVQAFADHNREDLFVKTLVVLHDHWPSRDSINHQQTDPAGHSYAKASDIHSFEPMIVDVLVNGDFWPALTEGAATLNNTTFNGRAGRRILADAGRYLVRPQPGLTSRLGVATTMTEDGVEVPVLSPWYVLADAYKLKRQRVAEQSTEGEAWERATSQMVDIFLRGEKVGDTWRFRNPNLRGVTVALVDLVNERVGAHRTAGDLAAWSRQELPQRLQEILTGPVFAGVADFVLSLSVAPEARAALEELNAYLMSEAGSPDAYAKALGGVADLVQLFLDDGDMVPIARMMGRALHPDFGFVDAQITFMQGARAADTTDALQKLLRNLFVEYRPGQTAVGEIVDVICEVHREDPVGDLGAPMASGDYRATLGAVADFIAEERRGFLKFVTIVKERNVQD